MMSHEYAPPVSCVYLPLIYIILAYDDIDAIMQRGEERTVHLNSKYEGLNLDHFKLDATVQQWVGEDFGTGVSHVCPCIFRSVVT
jgi:hypothetical protein